MSRIVKFKRTVECKRLCLVYFITFYSPDDDVEHRNLLTVTYSFIYFNRVRKRIYKIIEFI